MAVRTSTKLRDQAREGPDLDGLRTEMARLRSEIEAASRNAAGSGRDKLARGADAAQQQLDGMLEDGERLLGDLGRELRQIEDRAVAAVRDRPVQSIGIALVLGFLIALLFRR